MSVRWLSLPSQEDLEWSAGLSVCHETTARSSMGIYQLQPGCYTRRLQGRRGALLSLPAWIRRGLVSPELRKRQSAFYYARRYLQTPGWANSRAINQVYTEARRRSTATRRYVVDHIVPLKHPQVCGLHWEGNLQIVEEQHNAQKSNHWWPGKPEYQLDLPIEHDTAYQQELPL